VRVASDGQTELRTYLDGELYKAYPLGKKESSASKQITKRPDKTNKSAEPGEKKTDSAAPPSPTATYTPPESSQHMPSPPSVPSSRGSAEEKT
jgi:hypothetical protein